ncbi:MAG: hypothetical protein N0C84_05830 [Candidatus Thiodiazotropha taylori]|uniref:Uncharacterized protein n=1 Tax=Candidatus Thiodiazotropha taylori TaxID=2792791 RepID=A0A9E4K9Z8_9GAMM|nr:hypothetical protein [Candidatus Thiodiazotropha taylori]MCW4255973.1 hypothetical protein [Candidatus Thiodiazotropha taylori]
MFSVSARMRTIRDGDLLPHVAARSGLNPDQIDSVFGFLEHTPLYGGRPYAAREISESDVESLYKHGKGIRLPLTNHFIEPEEYRDQAGFLSKYHRKGNTVIAVNDEFARRVKNDYPDYEVEASAIQEIDTAEKVLHALELYDSVVLPVRCTTDEALLRDIPEGVRERVRIFATGGCAASCPSRICYRSFSKYNKSLSGDLLCSMETKPRHFEGKVIYDLRIPKSLGYTKFKVVP